MAMRTTSQRDSQNQLTLKAEHHHNREQQGDQCDWADPGDEFGVITRYLALRSTPG